MNFVTFPCMRLKSSVPHTIFKVAPYNLVKAYE